MKLKKLILILTASLACSLLFAAVPSQAHWSEEQLKEAGYVRQAKNKNLQLYYNKTTAVIAVMVNSTGYVWYSSPMDWEEDEFASGFTKNAMPSLLSIRAKDKNSTFRPANSYVNVVKRRGLSTERIDNGIRLEHTFVREGICIPLDVTLDGNSVVMSVPISEITEDEESESLLKLLDFKIDPYFGAASSDEDGFILVPDGCGAVIEFNNHKSETAYQQYVYGRDPSIIPVKKKTVTQTIALPVFGLSREEAGFIAVIESSAARGIINAETSGMTTNYNAVSASCIVRDFDAFTFREKSGTPRDIRIFEKDKMSLENIEDVFSVRYILLDEEENNLAGMAKAYRKFLQDQGKFTEEKTDAEPAMVLNFVGTSVKKLPLAGIPMNKYVSFTTCKNAVKTIEQLKDEGIENFIVKFDGWTEDGVLGNYPDKAKVSKKVGSSKEFNKFLAYLEEEGIQYYLGADFVNLYKEDAAHIKELTVNHAINRSPVKIPDYRLSTYTDEKQRDDKYPYWILRSPNVAKYYNKFMKSFDKNFASAGFAPDTIGNVVSSDFLDKKGTSRTRTVEIFTGLLDDTALKHSLCLSRPCDYALSYVSYAADLPVQTSMFDIENASVPFYQMVLKGYIPFSNLPGNRNTNLEDYKLSLIETGADPSFFWITDNPEYIRDSRMQNYVNAFMDDWKEAAVEITAEVLEVNEKTKGATIVSYTIDGDERITKFSNGVTVSVNYADKSYKVTKGKKAK